MRPALLKFAKEAPQGFFGRRRHDGWDSVP